MRHLTPARWAPPLATAGIWALALACTVFWGLRLSAPPAGPAYAPAQAAAPAAADPAVLALLLGAVSAAPASAPAVDIASRFVLQGVVAGRSKGGTALIAVDGRPARPYRVGSEVATGFVLRSVAPRRALLGQQAGDDVGLAMPALK